MNNDVLVGKDLVANDYVETIVAPGDRASQLARDICAKSYENCPALVVVPHDPQNFRGGVGITWRGHILQEMAKTKFSSDGRTAEDWTMMMAVENDGAGRKPGFATLGGSPELFANLGSEIIAMCADDLARTGRFPAYMVNQFDFAGITDENFHLVAALLDGYAGALWQERLVNITGEIAVMPGAITAFCYAGKKEQLALTWSGCCNGLVHRELLIDRKGIKPGMWIVGLREQGYRCNGGGFFIKLIEHHGLNGAEPFVRDLCTPSISYARTICRLIGWNLDGSIKEVDKRIKIAGVAHITGGGVWGKFGEMLPEGVGAILDAMPAPAPVLLVAQGLSKGTPHELSDYDAYGTLHGGCGMLVICETEEDAHAAIAECQHDGIGAQIVGRTIARTGKKLQIVSRFANHGEVLESKD